MRASLILSLCFSGNVFASCYEDDTPIHEPRDPFLMARCYGVDIEDATISSLQRSLILGDLTSRQLVECYLARIEQTNEYVSNFNIQN